MVLEPQLLVGGYQIDTVKPLLLIIGWLDDLGTSSTIKSVTESPTFRIFCGFFQPLECLTHSCLTWKGDTSPWGISKVYKVWNG